MKIKTKFHLISCVIIVSIMSMVAIIGYFGNDIYKSYECADELNVLTSSIYDQKAIIYDYLLKPTERSVVQFRMKQDTIDKLIGGMRYSKMRYPTEIERVTRKNRQIGSMFLKIIDMKSARDDVAGARLVSHLRRQIMINSERILALVARLHKVQHEHVSRVMINATLICLGIAVFSGIAIIIIHSMFAMRTVKMLRKLDTGAQFMTEGNYDFQTNIRTNDEIGELSLSFDVMAQALKDAIDKLRNWNEKLEIAVESRTEELKQTHTKLVTAERHAVLGRMSGMVAHELRTPLSAMKSSLYYLRTRLSAEASKNEKIEKHLNIIDSEVEASNRVITNILTYGRLGDPAFVQLDVNDLLKKHIPKQEFRRGIVFVFDQGSEPLYIEADSHQMDHVISNIVRNAMESIDGEGAIEIKASEKDGHVWIFVKDGGKGIAESQLSNIFEPLFTTKNTGMGFGLAICKAVVELHRGSIAVYSTEGKGTEVVIQLPIKQGG